MVNRRSQGCSGCTCTLRAEKKVFRRNLQGKFVSAPARQSKSQFLDIFLLGGGDLEVGVVHLVFLDRLLKATTKKR